MLSENNADAANIRSPLEQIRFAREILRDEANGILALSDRLGDDFCHAIDLLFHCQGSVLVAGIGKAGLIGQKLAATFASTGTRSHFLHPAEAMHGDLGRIHRDDCLLILSFSGETEEVLRMLPSVLEFGSPIVAMTGNTKSSLARSATVTLDLGPIQEACSLGLAPSTSTTAMLALGDALALVMSRMRQFSPRDFVRFHPGGNLGRRLTSVNEVMRPLAECRVASADLSVREVFTAVHRPGRRTGAIMLVDHHGKLEGIFTDSDLARLLESQRDSALGEPVRNVMTHRPKSVASGASLNDAWDILAGRKISELPVVDDAGRPLGLVDITDVLGLAPPQETLKKKIDAAKKKGTSRVRYDGPQVIPFPHRLPKPPAT
jgi:arabinose-5-phosphate isomerase